MNQQSKSKSNFEPHLEAIKLLRTAVENNQKEIDRLKEIPQSKKVIKRLQQLNNKLQKGVDKLRKNKVEVIQKSIF